MTWVLGIGGYSHDASAVLLKDGQLVAAVQEERLSRIKHQGGFPNKSISYCLDVAGIGPEEVDAVAFYAKRSNWDGYLFHSMKASLSNIRYTLMHPKGFVHTVGYRLYKSLSFRADLARFFYETGLTKSKFFDCDHHACHAASAYYSSPFDKSLILCIDGGGDGRTITAWIGQGNKLSEIDMGIKHPHSLGLIYTRITRYLGFPSPGDEYKVMGLAAYGEPVYFDKLKDLIRMEDNSFRLNMEYFNYQYEYAFSDKFYAMFGPPRGEGQEINEHYANMAASVQKLFEYVLCQLAYKLKNMTGIKNLCLTGGCSLNCRANGKLLLTGEFDDIFVPPGASDLGTSLGAAQYYYHHIGDNPKRFTMKRDDWGVEYTDEKIFKEIDRSGLSYEVLEDPAKTGAELIAQGKIVGWFQGRMEFGPRALGNRSILADPRNADMKDRINSTIKFREEFRPFAPSVLRGHVKDYFNADVNSPFMTYTLDILPEKRKEVQAIVHTDGSGRVQTVSEDDQPLYYDLIKKFFELTGTPVLLNTSFNLAGEPIVCSPYDAIRTFYTCGMDALIMGKYLIQK
jgi:carbamoyltransferase